MTSRMMCYPTMFVCVKRNLIVVSFETTWKLPVGVNCNVIVNGSPEASYFMGCLLIHVFVTHGESLG